MVTEFSSSHRVNFWVRCASGNVSFGHPRSWRSHSTWICSKKTLVTWLLTLDSKLTVCPFKGKTSLSFSALTLGCMMEEIFASWYQFESFFVLKAVALSYFKHCLKAVNFSSEQAPLLCHSLRLTAAVKSPLAMHWHWICTALYCIWVNFQNNALSLKPCMVTLITLSLYAQQGNFRNPKLKYCVVYRKRWVINTIHNTVYSTQRLPPNEAQSMLDWIREFLKYCHLK